MSYYQYHVFVCSHLRDGEPSCERFNASSHRDYLKKRMKALGVHQAGDVRVNKAGCFGRCDQGPVMVVYPEGIWYTYVDKEDIDEIIDSHLLGGVPVERLMIHD